MKKIIFLILALSLIYSHCFGFMLLGKTQNVAEIGGGGDTYLLYFNGDDCTTNREDASSAGSSCDIDGTLNLISVTSNNACAGSYALEINGLANRNLTYSLTYDVSELDGGMFVEFDLNLSTSNDGRQTLFQWVGGDNDRVFVDLNSDQTLIVIYKANGTNYQLTTTGTVTSSNCTQIQVKFDPDAGSNEIGARICNDGTCDAESWEYDSDNLSKFAVDLTTVELGEGNGAYNNATGTYNIDELKIWDNADQN